MDFPVDGFRVGGGVANVAAAITARSSRGRVGREGDAYPRSEQRRSRGRKRWDTGGGGRGARGAKSPAPDPGRQWTILLGEHEHCDAPQCRYLSGRSHVSAFTDAGILNHLNSYV